MRKVMEKELKYLKNQSLFWKYSDEIYQIRKDPDNQWDLEKGSTLGTAIDCFSLGIIVGKQIERKKRKINNDEILKRQEELLLEIEGLKLKNERLRKLVVDIKKESRQIMEIKAARVDKCEQSIIHHDNMI